MTITLEAASAHRAEIRGTPVVLDLTEVNAAVVAAEASAVAAAASQAAAAASATAADSSETDAETAQTAAAASAAAALSSETNAAASAASAAGAVAAIADEDYLVKTATSDLGNERVVTDTTQIAWDWATAGQAKANFAAGCVNAQTLVTIVGTDHVLIADASDSGNVKKGLVSDISTLAAAAVPNGMVLLSVQTASASATIDFTTGLDNTYDEYLFTFDCVPATDDVYLMLRVGTGGGPTWQADAADYSWGGVAYAPGGTVGIGSVADSIDTQIPLSRSGAGNGVGNASGEHISGTVRFSNPEVTQFAAFAGTTTFVRSDGLGSGAGVSGIHRTSAAITGVRFLFSSGNIASGVFRLYGLRKTV